MEKHFGKLSRGCALCFVGKKSVLFVTGICPRNCIYCPISPERKNKDVVYINELKTKNTKNILQEINLSNSSGVGITGGDPLSKLSLTISLIKKFKKEFGKSFHIHLYTSLNLLDDKSIKKLQKSGLDELRIHPDLFDRKNWGKLNLMSKKFKEVGIEIPVLPKYEKGIIDLIEFAKNKVDFFNLNELEYAINKEKIYAEKKWKVHQNYGVAGSEKLAKKILNSFKKLRIHYCSARFKDSVQFRERLKQRAKKVAKKFDKITSDGLLVHGAVSGEKNKLIEYRKQSPVSISSSMFSVLPKSQRKSEEFREVKKELIKMKKPFFYDDKKSRIIFGIDTAKKLAKKFKGIFITEEYPTSDSQEVYKEVLS